MTTSVSGDESQERVEALIRGLRSDQPWALFLGAGASVGAGAPSWKTFVDKAAAEFGIDFDDQVPATNYPLVLQRCHEAAESDDEFWSFVEAKLCGTATPTRLQRLLLKLPFDVFVTSNLDCLLEVPHAERTDVGTPRTLVYPNLPPTKLSDRRLAYIHGRCPCADEPHQKLTAVNSVLTETSYRIGYAEGSTLELAGRTLMGTLRVLFVGASFQDPIFALLMRGLDQIYRDIPIASAHERHYALVSTPTERVNDLSWPGSNWGVVPIWYPVSEGDKHSALTEVAEYLVKLTLGET